MADSTSTATTSTENTDSGKSGFTPPTSQEELDAIIKERIARERKKYEDYGDLKAKAKRLEEIEEANATEVERAIKRAEKAEAELASLKRSQTLRSIADEYGISKDDLDFIEGPDEETIRAKAERLAARLKREEEEKPAEEKVDDTRVGFTVDGLGQRTQTGGTSRDEAARAFFGV